MSREFVTLDRRDLESMVRRMVKEELGRELFANIAALGVIAGATGVVGSSALEAALLSGASWKLFARLSTVS